jgi:hypothetical protein
VKHAASDETPTVTKDGLPWTTWNKGDEFSGWTAPGTRRVTMPSGPVSKSFWETVLALAAGPTAKFDAADCIGPDGLHGGAARAHLMTPFTSGTLELLLLECLRAHPEEWLDAMAPVLRELAVYPVATSDAFIHPARLMHMDRGILHEAWQVQCAVRGGSDGKKWTAKQKRQARLWVTCISKLLKYECMDAVQVKWCSKIAPGTLSARALQVLAWPTNGAEDSWMFTEDQARLWAVAMALGITTWGKEGTSLLIIDSVQTEPADAKASLTNLAKVWGGAASMAAALSAREG